MIKRKLSQNIIEYIFDPKPGKHFGNRITVLTSGSRAVLIDTGYEHQTAEVIEDLAADQIAIEKVIITHFHDDHMEGLKLLPGVTVYGSSNYKPTLDKWIPEEEHKYYTPTVFVKDCMKLQFGEHELELIPFPGHSICTILVKIDNRYLHVADELMFSNAGEPLLPSLSMEDVKNQYESVNKLKDYMDYTFIFGHGDGIRDKAQIMDIIENTRLYLDQILSSTTKISYEEATKACTCIFLHKEWHDNIYS